MKAGGKRGLYCMDWEVLDNELAIWSVTDDDNYQRWEHVLLPCNYIHNLHGDIGDTISDDCIPDLE